MPVGQKPATTKEEEVLTCKKEEWSWGYVTFRRIALRSTDAALLREVCRDVRTEPSLLPVPPNKSCHPPSTNTKDQARLDIVATELWKLLKEHILFLFKEYLSVSYLLFSCRLRFF